MAEFCRKCFIDIFHPSEDDIRNLEMSEDMELCEGCGEVKSVVVKIKNE